MKILQVADRPGWAIDRLSKPISEFYENVDMSYVNTAADRFLDTGFSDWKSSVQYTHELGSQYDIVHFHRLEAAVIGIDTLRPETKRFLTIHTERLKDFDDKRILLFDHIICPTKFAYEYLKKNLEEWKNEKTQIHQVGYGIDLEKFRRQADLHHIPHHINLSNYYLLAREPNAKEIGFVGRIVKWKRYAKIQKAVHDIGLKLIGCGYIEDSREYNANGLKDDEDFYFHAMVPECLMSRFYARMNLFICLSEPHVEAGPLPILEAMACGVPVLSTRVGWTVDNCEHLKNIYFIEENEIDNLPQIIKSVYDNKELRAKLREGGLELIKNFDVKHYAEELMKLYEQS